MPKLSVEESFTVALFSDSEKVWIGGGGESRFSVELFLSQSARKIRRESFTVALLLGYRKSLEKRWGGGHLDFTSKIYCLTVPKSFVWESITVELFSGTENVWRRGVIKILRRKVFDSQCRSFP